MNFSLIFIVCLVLGCNSSSSNTVKKTPKTQNSSLTADTISLENLSIVSGDSTIKNFYFLDHMSFTGNAIKYGWAKDEKWSFVYSFENGVMQRLDVYGVGNYKHRFVEMKNGYEYHTVMFHRNGKPYLEEFYNKRKEPIGKWKRWDRFGELEWEKTFEGLENY